MLRTCFYALLVLQASVVYSRADPTAGGLPAPDANVPGIFSLLNVHPLTTDGPEPAVFEQSGPTGLTVAFAWGETPAPDTIELVDNTEPIPDPVAKPPVAPEPVPAPIAGSLADNDPLTRPIGLLTLDGDAAEPLRAGVDKLPEEFAITDKALERFGSWSEPVTEAASSPPRFDGQLYTWAAPAVFHGPLLFEQPNLERYGHHVAVCRCDNLSQSAISAAHFFATAPVLPYKIGATGGLIGWPCESARDYTLGHYRPGSHNPHQLLRPRLSLRGLAYQAAATTGLVYLIP